MITRRAQNKPTHIILLVGVGVVEIKSLHVSVAKVAKGLVEFFAVLHQSFTIKTNSTMHVIVGFFVVFHCQLGDNTKIINVTMTT